MPVNAPAAGVPAGTVDYFAANTPPSGWIKANGAAVSRTLYGRLFTAIGTTYGAGDGSTTFNVPDLRGEFLRGWDDGRGVDSGRSIGAAQAADYASHSHSPMSGTVNTNSDVGKLNGSRGFLGGYINAEGYFANNSASQAFIQASGGTETRPRNVALLACIKF